MSEVHVLPSGNRWHVNHNGSCIAVYNSREEALRHACNLARSANGTPADTHAVIVLHDLEQNIQHRMTVPRSEILQ